MQAHRLVSVAASLVVLSAGILTAQPAQADGVLSDAQCGNPTLLAKGTTRHTDAGFTQRVDALRCIDTGVIYGRIIYDPDPGYAGSHVQACSAHVGLVDEDTGWHQDRAFECTAAARTGLTRILTAEQGWTTTNGVLHRYHMTGYVNIRTSEYKNTYPQASRASFFW